MLAASCGLNTAPGTLGAMRLANIPRDMVVVGVDLGGTNMQIGVVNAEGKVVGRAKRKTKAH